MKNDKRLDEAFRQGLPSVEVPPPPPQDWAAMARAAKQGARAAAVRDSGSLLNTRWLRLLGGASAILAAWYLASGPEAAPQAPGQAAGPTDTPAAHAEFLGDAPAELIGLVGEQAAGEASKTPLPVTAVRTGEPLREKATTRQVIGLKEGLDSSSGTADGNADHFSEAKLNGWGKRTAADGMQEAAQERQNAGTPVVPGSPSESTAADASTSTTVKDAPEGPHVLAVLPPLSSALPYTPNDPPAQTTTNGPSLVHWSIAPWFALGHTRWTDPENGDNGSLEQLSVGHEQPGSIGLRIQYAFDHRFAMITGIQYARKGGLRGTVRSSPFLTTDYKLSGDYLEVPLSLKFSLPMENKELYVRAGGVLQFNKNSGMDKVAMNDASRKELSTLVLASGSMGTALDIGIGAQFRLSHHVGLFIEPSYQYALSPVVKHPSFDKLPFNPRIHTFALATGLSFQFP